MPETELLLFAACHSQMTSHLVAPALKRGAVILCDRFYDSTMAYQGYARTLNRDFVAEINAFSCRGITPDLTLVLDLDPAEGIRRSHARASAEEVAETVSTRRRCSSITTSAMRFSTLRRKSRNGSP